MKTEKDVRMSGAVSCVLWQMSARHVDGGRDGRIGDNIGPTTVSNIVRQQTFVSTIQMAQSTIHMSAATTLLLKDHLTICIPNFCWGYCEGSVKDIIKS